MTVVKLTANQIEALRERMEQDRFEFRSLDHAYFQARGPGVVVNAYRSGKVVIQGKQADFFVKSNDLGDDALAPRAGGGGAAGGARTLEVTTVGSDESGKGDYFGPLVVAAVVVEPGQEEEIARAGVRDCKLMSDSGVMRAAIAVRDLCPHSIVRLDPQEYNLQHKKDGNVAIFLSAMHAQAIAEAIKDAPDCRQVVIDKFTFEKRLEDALEEQGVDLDVEIRTKAEDNPSVAAASVLARAEFLIGLKELGAEFGVNLPKGAGPAAEGAARDLFRVGGRAALDEVAKTHFRTTQRVTQTEF